MFLWKTNSSFGPCILQSWATVSLTNTLQKFNPFQTLALSWRNPHHIWTRTISTTIHYILGATIKITFSSGSPLSSCDIELCISFCRCCELSTIKGLLVNPSVLPGIATRWLWSGTQPSWTTMELHLASGGSRFNISPLVSAVH